MGHLRGRELHGGPMSQHSDCEKNTRNTKIDCGFEEPHSLPPSEGRRKAITLRGEGAHHPRSRYSFFGPSRSPIGGIEHLLGGPGQ